MALRTGGAFAGKRISDHVLGVLGRAHSVDVLKQIASFGLGEALARGLNWALMALLPLFLASSGEYGKVGLLVSLEVLISNISLMGMDRAVLRFCATGQSPGKFLKAAIVVWGSLAWIPLAIVLALSLVGNETLLGLPLIPHLLWLTAAIAIFNLNSLCVCIGRAKNELPVFLRFRLCSVAMKFLCVLWMASILRHSFSYVLGMALSLLVMLLLMRPFLREHLGSRADRETVTQLVLFGWPFVFHILSGNILTYFSRFFLQMYGSASQVGIFTFSFTLGSAVYVGLAALSTYFEPRIYGYSDDEPRRERWLACYTAGCTTIASAGGAAVLLFYPLLTGYLSPDYSQASSTVSIILGTVLLAPLYLQGNYRLTALRKTSYIAIMSSLAAAISLGMNILLIPSLGIWGAATALYVSNFALCALILVTSIWVSDAPFRCQYSLLTYCLCTLGSLSTVIWADNPRSVVLVLLVVSLVSLGVVLGFVFKNKRRVAQQP